MSSLPHTLLFFLIALTVLIAVHEYGHFWVARKCGVKVLRFSLGFGKVIWRFQKSPRDTEFTVSLLPLGGYVRMVDEREGDVLPEDLEVAFNRKPLWVRTAIVVAGPVFNLILAVLIYWLIFMWGETGSPPVLGSMQSVSLAAEAGFLEGDQIVRVNGRNTPTWSLAMGAIMESAMEEEPVSVEVTSAIGEARTVRLEVPREELLKPEALYGRLGFQPQELPLPPIVDRTEPQSRAELAGLLPGDRLLRMDGNPIGDWRDWAAYVRARPEVPIDLLIDRGGVEIHLSLIPAAVDPEAAGQPPKSRPLSDQGASSVNSSPSTEAVSAPVGRVGAMVRMPEGALVEYRLNPWEALLAAVERTFDYAVATIKIAGRMLVGQAAVDNLSGPISIAQLAGKSASLGTEYFLKFLALVSISLGVLNLLPIPVLDGGHLFFYLIEAVRGRPLAEETQIRLQQIGMMVLMALMILGLYLDIGRLQAP